MIRGVLPAATDDEVEDMVRTRIERQAGLKNPTPLKLWAVLAEAALHRTVGGEDVMRAQLSHLISLVAVALSPRKSVSFVAEMNGD